MNKEIKKSIKYYLSNAKQFESQNDSEDKNVNSENINREESGCENRTDYFENSVIAKVTIYDVLSNEGVSKLLRKLYLLSSRKFKVRNYYNLNP